MNNSYRILMCSETWLGGAGHSCLRGLRRLGHSVSNVPESEFVPKWGSMPLRVCRRALFPIIVKEFNTAIIEHARNVKPDFFLAVKGQFVTKKTLLELKRMGIRTYNYYPDVSFLTHGPWIPESISAYDWIFSTKPFHAPDLLELFGVRNATYLPHGYDDELHRPVQLTEEDRIQYGSDVILISTYTPKKWRYLEAIMEQLPDIRLRIYGNYGERGRGSAVAEHHANFCLYGRDYVTAIAAAKIALGFLSESVGRSSQGDQTAMRSYEIPAIGTCMIHERTDEIRGMLKENEEVFLFDGAAELVSTVRKCLSDDALRQSVAEAGHRRITNDGNSYLDRVKQVIDHHESTNTKYGNGRVMVSVGPAAVVVS